MKIIKSLLLIVLLAATSNMVAMDKGDKNQPNELATASRKRALEFTCFHCNDAFPDACELATHQQAAHPTKHNVRIPARYLEELKTQKNLPDLACKFCAITFKDTSLLNFHISNDHHRCTVCFEEVADSYLHTKEKHPETITEIKFETTDDDF
jgi:hypothetical protein